MFCNCKDFNFVMFQLLFGDSKSQFNILFYIILEVYLIILLSFNYTWLLQEKGFCWSSIEGYHMLHLIMLIFKPQITKAFNGLKFAGQITLFICSCILKKFVACIVLRSTHFQKSPVTLIRIVFISTFKNVILIIHYPKTVW